MFERVKAYPAVFEKVKDGFSIYFPDIDGCISISDTLEEGFLMAKEALTLHLSGMIEDDEVLPIPDLIHSKEEAKNNFIALIEPDKLLLSKLLKGRSKRINITLNEYILELADKKANELNISRSSLIESGLKAVV